MELAKLLTEGFIVGFIRSEYFEYNCIPEPADSERLPSPLPSTQSSHLENKNAAWFQLSMRLIGKLTLVAWVPHSIQDPIMHYPIAKNTWERWDWQSHLQSSGQQQSHPPPGLWGKPLLLTLLSCESVVYLWMTPTSVVQSGAQLATYRTINIKEIKTHSCLHQWCWGEAGQQFDVPCNHITENLS